MHKLIVQCSNYGSDRDHTDQTMLKINMQLWKYSYIPPSCTIDAYQEDRYVRDYCYISKLQELSELYALARQGELQLQFI